ncbi:MAG: UbiX family flavin prenyltransferase [Deltaproteobacteria bacterium]|nr:UbiX family flavin prenyltransferase [Deltaproteobacteria bacterium]
MSKKRIIVAVTGASGAVYGVKILEFLSKASFETHLILSDNSKITLNLETCYSVSDLSQLASFTYSGSDMTAPVASGSFQTMGMIVAPCSMKTLAEIANGISSSLVTRAADVILKERRKLILLTRETPLHAIHLKNMLSVTQSGGIVFPPVPGFYNKPSSIDDIINHTISRVLDLVGIENSLAPRWGMSI